MQSNGQVDQKDRNCETMSYWTQSHEMKTRLYAKEAYGIILDLLVK